MSEQYGNNPLHGLKLEALIEELVDFYGYEILGEALNFKCFQLNPSIKGSLKFLKKTEWARVRIEAFYLYKFKNLPRPDASQYDLPPRDRIVPDHQKPREPKTFTLEELKEINARKAKLSEGPNKRPSAKKNNYQKANNRKKEINKPSPKAAEDASESDASFDPWGEAKKKLNSSKPRL